MAKKRIRQQFANMEYEQGVFSISIQNENGIHTHKRNGESFTGKQTDCPLCKTGSPFEQSFGVIGA